ncbi:MAG TPA: hypothetical protein VFX70_10380, partial [Mycobacteriales bacterium]|nr:hypothetical protein [Mycobacteriales bacterium]
RGGGRVRPRIVMVFQGDAQFRGDDPTEFRTGKAAKAAAARARGQAIEVLTEWEFLAMLDDTVSQGVRTTGVGEPHRGLADSPVA